MDWHGIAQKQMAFSHHSMMVVGFLGILFAIGLIIIFTTAFRNR